MSNLAPSQLLKYNWRRDLFLEKYKNNGVFELIGGQKVQLVYEELIYNAIQNKDVKLLQKIRVRDQESKELYKLSSIKKTSDFGGKPDGTSAGMETEIQEIAKLNEQLNNLKKITGQSNILIIKVGHVAACIKTKGTHKSDFTLVDGYGSPVAYISYKKGSRPQDFQNWSGMTDTAIFKHSEIQSFIKDVSQLYPDGLPNKMTIARPIKNEYLQNQAVYGNDYSTHTTIGHFGPNNVNVVLQGPIQLQAYEGGTSLFRWELMANHVHYSGDIMNGGYEPTLMAIYKGDRNNFGLKGTRFAIQPRNSRLVKLWI